MCGFPVLRNIGRGGREHAHMLLLDLGDLALKHLYLVLQQLDVVLADGCWRAQAHSTSACEVVLAMSLARSSLLDLMACCGQKGQLRNWLHWGEFN